MPVESGYTKQRTIFGRPVGQVLPVEATRTIVGRDPQREVQTEDSFYPMRNCRYAKPIAAEFVGNTLYVREENMRMTPAPAEFQVGSRLRPLTRIVGWAVTQVAVPPNALAARQR